MTGRKGGVEMRTLPDPATIGLVDYVPIERVATKWNVTLNHALAIAKRGEVPGARKINGHWYFHQPLLAAWEDNGGNISDELRQKHRWNPSTRRGWPHKYDDYPPVIYFLRFDDAVRIGYTACLKNRLSQHQSSLPRPIQLVGLMPGDRDDEYDIHERFDAHHLHGEWFTLCDVIRTFIHENAKIKTEWL